MSRHRYRTGKDMITAALYSAGKEDATGRGKPADAETIAIIANRLNQVIEGISISAMLREELIACGLSPDLVANGIKYHVEFLQCQNQALNGLDAGGSGIRKNTNDGNASGGS